MSFRPLVRPLALGVASTVLLGGVAYAQGDELPMGVYVWGDNTNKLVSNIPDTQIKIPIPVKYFENKYVKDLAISPEVAAAVLPSGKVVQWTQADDQYEVNGLKGIEQVRVFGDIVATRSKNGDIFCWHAGSSSGRLQKFKHEGLGWFEKIVDFDMGRDHIVALTSRGRVMTGLTQSIAHHNGQLGIASLPSFDTAPDPYQLYHVRLLHGTPITKVASGDEHVLMLAKAGEVYGCGSNSFGQLMNKVKPLNPNINVPTKLQTPLGSRIVDIAAGGSTTFVQADDGKSYVCGNGINGLFGTGSFSHVQKAPLRIPMLENMSEFSETLNKVVPITPCKWSVSPTHVFVQLDNASKSWLIWGSNKFGELGNGRLFKVVKPAQIVQSPLAQLVRGNTFVAGDGISAAYTRK